MAKWRERGSDDKAAFARLCPGLCTVQSELTWFCPALPDGIFSLQKPVFLTLRIRDGRNGSCDHKNASVQREKEMVKKDHTHATRDTDIQGPHSHHSGSPALDCRAVYRTNGAEYGIPNEENSLVPCIITELSSHLPGNSVCGNNHQTEAGWILQNHTAT